MFLFPMNAKRTVINTEFHHVNEFRSFQLHPKLEAFIYDIEFRNMFLVVNQFFDHWIILDPRAAPWIPTGLGPRQQNPDPEIGQRISPSPKLREVWRETDRMEKMMEKMAMAVFLLVINGGFPIVVNSDSW